MRGLLNLFDRARRGRPPVGSTPADVVHHENKWRLLRYRPGPNGRRYETPLLLVPSLINRHYVLDLLPGKSFAEWMVNAGHDVYIVDWGTPADEDRYLTFDDICDRYVGRAIRKACKIAETPKTHVLGYCLGGTLTAIHTAARPEHVATLTLLAAPVNFHDDGLLSRWVRTPTFDVGSIIAAYGNVPWQLMQGAFHLLRPTLTVAKAVGVLDRAWDDEFLDGFFAIETWGNDNVRFPGECYRRYVEELYRQNALVNDAFFLSGRPARLGSIDCPTLAVTFEHDNIVPHRSASCILEKIASTDKHHVHLMGGHVGAVVSKSASKKLWPGLSAFWAEREPKKRKAVRRARPPSARSTAADSKER